MSSTIRVCVWSACVIALGACAGTKKETSAPDPPSGDLSELMAFDQPPKPKDTVAPIYPRAAREDGLQGEVTLKVRLDERGAVSSVEVVESTAEVFEGPAKEALMKWVFEPATQDGKPVKATILVPLKFSLNKDGP